MIKAIITASVVALIAGLGGCDWFNRGKHVGQLLQDCPAIQPNQKERAATLIKGDLTRDQAAQNLANAFGISKDEALKCLKENSALLDDAMGDSATITFTTGTYIESDAVNEVVVE